MKAIVTFQGFTESDSSRSGTEDLYWHVIRKFSSEDVTTDWPRQWTADVKKLAELLARQRVRNIAMVSYSHGQAAAVDFAKVAYGLGMDVDLWLVCDPVYRPTWLPRWNWLQPLAFRALFKTARIKAPHNVRVAGVRQDISCPSGHSLTPDWPLEKIPYCHITIDQSPEWFALVKRELSAWVQK